MKNLVNKAQILLQLIVALVAVNCSATAQDLADLQQRLASYQKNSFTEKLYVHTDKSFYVTGELLWFKIYAVDGSMNKPADLSKVAYVDVLDASQNPVMQGKIALNKGSGNGSFYIPLNLQNGTYRLRGYTNWMKNSSPELYFEKVITIVNPLKSPAAVQAKVTAPAYDIQFFPEGGDMVNGLPGKVAFKLTGADGKGADFYGAVINQQNDTLVRFRPVKFGIGSFVFTPVAGNTYRAVIKVQGGRPFYQPLPDARPNGYAMQLTNAGDYIQLNITATAGSYPSLYCIVHNHRQVVDAQNVIISGSGAQVAVAKSKLADGMNYITLFNSKRQPIAERLYFKRPQKQLTLNVALAQQQYGTRKPVSLTITSATGATQAAQADLSIAVYRLDSLQKADHHSIYSYLWLGAELKGWIEQPDFYFEHNDKLSDEALDNLLLTQGWRRFNWSQVLSPVYSPAYLPEYAGHIITGRLFDNATGKAATNVVAYLGSPGKRADLYAARSDTGGKLRFETKDFYGPREIILQTNIRHDSTYRVDIQSPFSEQYAAHTLPAFELSPGAGQDLRDYSLSMQVENVYSGNRLRRYFNPGVDSSSFYARPTKTYMLEDFTRFTTMEEVLREYVTSISVTNRQHHFHIRTIDETSFLEDEPLAMLDGIPVFDMDRVFAIDPLKVKKLEVVSNRYYYGPALFEGILSFTTYKGDLGGFELDPHAVILDYEGLQLQREFYSPVYGNAQQTASRIPDFRNVLYWEPSAGTSPQGKSSLQFYTSDLPGSYVINIEGITANGEAGSRQVLFEVKK